jgi:hypothetical protein
MKISPELAGSHVRTTGCKGEYVPRNKPQIHPTNLTYSTVVIGWKALVLHEDFVELLGLGCLDRMLEK